jgi:hypothetical protein
MNQIEPNDEQLKSGPAQGSTQESFLRKNQGNTADEPLTSKLSPYEPKKTIMSWNEPDQRINTSLLLSWSFHWNCEDIYIPT